jgi:hypothetical protein
MNFDVLFGMFSDGKISTEEYYEGKTNGKGVGKLNLFILDACTLYGCVSNGKRS